MFHYFRQTLLIYYTMPLMFPFLGHCAPNVSKKKHLTPGRDPGQNIYPPKKTASLFFKYLQYE